MWITWWWCTFLQIWWHLNGFPLLLEHSCARRNLRSGVQVLAGSLWLPSWPASCSSLRARAAGGRSWWLVLLFALLSFFKIWRSASGRHCSQSPSCSKSSAFHCLWNWEQYLNIAVSFMLISLTEAEVVSLTTSSWACALLPWELKIIIILRIGS